jgi:hypothetical protein
VEAIHILAGVQRRHDSLLVQVARQRQLHQHAVYGCICRNSCYSLLQLCLADGLWQANDPAREEVANVRYLE